MANEKLLVVALLLSIFAINIISSQETCKPNCSRTKVFSKVVDPQNCSNYFTCMHQEPLDHSTPCRDGKIFDPSLLECIDGANCKPECGGDGSKKCKLTCSADVKRINDPFDCNIYYKCGPFGPGPEQHCPDNAPYYHSTGDMCVKDKSVCCVPSCEAECVEVPSLIPDPFDCTKYYLCQEEGEPTEDFYFQCDGGEYFNLASGRCSPDAKCQTLCTVTPMPGVASSSGGSSVPMNNPVTPVPTTDCVAELTCVAIGNFPKCHSCQPQYFSCNQTGVLGTEKMCSNGFVFNTDPYYPSCVLVTNCPYHPHKNPIHFLRN